MLHRLTLCGVVAAAYLGFPARAGANLVQNPGFEAAEKDPWNDGSIGCSLTTESPRSGSKCFKVEMQPSGGGSHGLFYLWQSIKGDWQGKTFKFGAWMRLANTTSTCGITIKFYETFRGAGGYEKVHIISWEGGTTDWTHFEGTYDAQATTQEILIYMLCNPGTGAAYCDDFHLELACNNPSQCDDNDPCTTDTCSNNTCQHTDICTDAGIAPADGSVPADDAGITPADGSVPAHDAAVPGDTGGAAVPDAGPPLEDSGSSTPDSNHDMRGLVGGCSVPTAVSPWPPLLLLGLLFVRRRRR